MPQPLPVKEFNKIVIPGNAASATIHWQVPESVKITVRKKAKRLLQKDPAAIAERKLQKEGRKKFNAMFQNSKSDLLELLSCLDNIFHTMLNIEVVNAQEAEEAEEVKMSDSLVTTPAKKTARDVLEKNAQKTIEEQLEPGMKTFLRNAESKLNRIDSYLRPLYKAINTGCAWGDVQLYSLRMLHLHY